MDTGKSTNKSYKMYENLKGKSPDSKINVKVELGEGDDKVSLDAIAERAKKY